ncbi:MAG TPA: glycosyltransferase family 39 protein [Planctomycetota bacterium]|nr:glycosyltransferase family 39 protein [Planctomycetota bacterium]
MSERTRTLVSVLTVAAVAAAMLLPWLGSMTLFDVDEPRFAEAARSMHETGDLLIPYFNGEVRYDKPPLIYWVMLAGYRIFGVNEWGARIGSAIAAIGSCLMIFAIARAMFGRRAGMVSAIMAATTLLIVIESRTATADSVLLFTILVMFYGFWRIHSGHRRIGSYALMYGGLAAGSLTKGPVSLAILIVTLLLYAMLRRDYSLGRRPAAAQWLSEVWLVARETHIWLGLLFTVLVVLAWFIPALVATQGGFFTDGFVRHVVYRSFGSEAMESHRGIPVVFYLVILPVAFFPWFAILPESCRRFWNDRTDPGRRAFLLAWAIAPFLVFSFLTTKLFHYTMPAYPALAMICGWAASSAYDERRTFLAHWAGKTGIGIFAATGIAVAAGILIYPAIIRWEELVKSMIAPHVALLVLTCGAFLLLRSVRNRLAVPGIALLTMIATLVLLGTGAASLRRSAMFKNLAAEVKAELKPGDSVVHVGTLQPSLVFYLQRPILSADNTDELTGILRKSTRCICIAQTSKAEIIERAGGVKLKEGSYFDTRKMKWRQMGVWEVRAGAGDEDEGMKR